MRELPLRLAPLLAALALAGCAASLGPTAERATLVPAELPTLAPSATARPDATLSIDRWWTLFGDAALDRLIAEALERNHDLALAAARVREARARLDEVRGSQAPSLDLQAAGGRSKSSRDSLPPGAERISNTHSAALVGRYELDLWGRLASGSEAARQRLLSEQWARATIEWSLTAQLAEAHFALRTVQRQIEIAESMRDTRATTLNLRRREVGAGIGTEFDLRRAEAELSGTEVTLSSLRRQRVELEGTLALLAGRPLAELAAAEPAREALDARQPFLARLPQGDTATMLLGRPDVRQGEAELAATRADIAAARAATLPSVVLSGSIGSDVRSLSNLFTASGMVWAIAASASQAVFDGGQRRARVEQADARADQAFAAYRKTVLGAVIELRDAYAALDLAQEALRHERERVDSLERARRLAATGYAAGALGYLDLLDAERNHFQAQLDEAGAQRDRLLEQIAVFKALGGGHAGLGPLASNQN